MAKTKTKGKSALSEVIRTYLLANPTHTWKPAEKEMTAKGVTESYFNNYKTILRNEGLLPDKKTAKTAKDSKSSKPSKPHRVGRPSKPATQQNAGSATQQPAQSAQPAHNDLADAAEFARKVGGLDVARQLLDDLKNVQV